jgi:hypothetical protein
MSAPLDLCEWLGTATRGLPVRIKTRIYDELTDHYQDAYDDARDEGSSAEEAHQQALARLGDARLTARAMRHTHLARRRYAWAMGAAIASLLWVVVGALMMGSVLLFNLFGFALAIYVLRAFKRMLDADVEAITLPSQAQLSAGFKPPNAFVVIEVCTLLVVLAGIAGNLDSLHYPTTIMLTDPLILGRDNLYPQEITAIHVLMTVGMGGVGIGWLLLSERLIDQSGGLYRLASILRAAIMIVGLGLVASGVALLMRNPDALNFASLIAGAAGFARQALLTLLFYRAAFDIGQRPQPRGLA